MSKSSSVIPPTEAKYENEAPQIVHIPQPLITEKKNEPENVSNSKLIANVSLRQLQNKIRSPVQSPIIIDHKIINTVCLMGRVQNIKSFGNVVKFDLCGLNASIPIELWMPNSVLRLLKIKKNQMYKIHGKVTIVNESAHINCFKIEAITNMDEFTYHCLEVTHEHICNSDLLANMTHNMFSFISAPQFKTTQGCTFEDIYSNFTEANDSNKSKEKIGQALQTLIDKKYVEYDQKYYKPISKLNAAD